MQVVILGTFSIFSSMKEYVILVDSKDRAIGTMEKMEAHKKGSLHRAFSVFLFNSRGETLMQKRASTKYHSPLLWTNSCCSHPRSGETTIEAARRRIEEELGVSLCISDLKEEFSFTYEAEFNNGLKEHEFDHVFSAKANNCNFNLNKSEVDDIKWISLEELFDEVNKFPQNFTEWFKIILKNYQNHFSYESNS